jgi:type I restriction enzyme S subunit
MEGWKQTEIGIIPNDWKCSSIKDISITCKAGGTPRKNQKEFWENGNIPFVLIEDMTSVLMYLKETKNFINQNGLESCSAWLVPEDTVLLSMYATVGKAVINKIPVATNQAILAIVTKPDICKEFLAFVLGSNSQRLLSYNVQSTQKNVNKGIVEQFKIPLPPPPEQRKIAHVLSTVQKAIEQQDKLIRTTTELKKALMQKLFTEGTRGEPQKETEIGLVPESWEVVKIEKLIIKTKIKDPGKEPEKEFIYVDVSSVSNEFFRIENTSKILGKEAPSRARKLIQDGDVIFATVRPTLKRIAKISQDYHNQICSTGYCVIKPDPDELIQEYLYQYLQTDFFIEKIEKLQRGASYPAVRDTDVEGMYIPLPKLSEQKEIGRTLNILDQRNNVLISKKQTLTALFKTLLHELMTGQRRVHKLEFNEDLTL